MKKPLTFLFSALLVLYADTIHATNYYFSSSTGNDAYTSTQAQNPSTPWQSLNKLNSFFLNLRPGDSVLFKCDDIFYGKILINKSGLLGLPIVLTSYGTGAKPIITGFKDITFWTNIGTNLWESSPATTPSSMLNMVTINGSFQPIGRYPKLTAPNGGYLTLQSHSGTSSITSNQISSIPDFTGGEVVVRANHWTLDRGTIISQTSSTVNYVPINGPLNYYEPTDGYGFFFQNHINACTQQGEWAFNTSSKKLEMFSSNAPSGVKVTAIDTLVVIGGSSYTILANLDIQGANSYLVFISNTSANHDLTFDNCNFSYSGIDGIYFQNDNPNHVTISNCTINYINNNGIYASTAPYVTITNNVISNVGVIAGMGQSGDGQYFGIEYIGSNSNVQYNEIYNIGYTAVMFSGGNLTIQNNFIHEFCKLKDDGGGIYTFDNGNPGSNGINRKILNNIITNGGGVTTDYGTNNTPSTRGIYLDGDGSYVNVYGNTVANIWGSGFSTNSGTNNVVSYNTFYDNRTAAFGITEYDASHSPSNYTVKHNIFFAKDSSLVAFFESNVSSPSTWGSFDSNYYCRPIFEPSGITQVPCFNLYNFNYCKNGGIIEAYNVPMSKGTDYSLDTWKTTFGQDAHSKKSPKTVSSVNDIRFEYNATQSPKTINLGATYIGVDSTIYSGTITLAPYTSKVLIYLSGIISNQPPVANAGPDQNFFLPINSATLTGSGTDADGSIASYQWTKISGPSQFTIVSPSQAQTVISNLVQGIYQFQLTVTDNLGATGKDTVQISVNAANIAPTANAGPNQNITLPTNSVTVTGSGSDPDGTIASYQWTKISGPSQFTIVSPSQAQTVISNLVQGTYQFQLTVTDNLGATGRDTVQISVNSANIAPTANAGTNQNITLPTNSVTVTGSGSDPDGTIASYQWTKISGPSQFTIVSPSQAQTVISNLVQGTYQFQLTVTDNLGATGRDTVQISVNAANIAPTANAGPNQNITLPTNSVIVTGSGSDPDGTIASYQWTKISGPLQFTIVSPSQAQTVISNLVQGTYQFQLTVTDNLGATGKDTVQITVNAANIAPTANAGPNQNITLPTNSVTVSGSGSDPDGSIASYQWTKISGPSQFTIVSPTQAQTVISNLVQGTYQFQLTVTDNLGATGKDTVQITVNAANIAPTANAGPNQNITLPTNSVTVSGSGSDPDGTIASYQWTKISGPSQFTIVSPSQAQTVISNLVQGTYQFQLTVTDNLGVTGKDTVQITVNAANIAPTANAGPNQNITLPTNSVTVSGSGSDPDGSIASYQWTKISGPSQFTIVSPTQAQTVISNLVQGTYQFQLTVTDNLGATGRDTVQITVNAANIAPTANAGPNQNITLPTNSVTVSGSGSDPDGSIASYQWTKISGPSQFTIVSPSQAQTVISNLVQGTYQFQLTVTDNLGATGRDTVQITVNAANIAPTANAGPNQNITLPTNSVTVSGSGSDPDGRIASYQWTKISGPSQFTIVSPTQAQTVISNLVQGTYQFQLTVTDNLGATGRDTVQITVNAANIAPTANAGPNQNITLPTNSVTVSGSGSDPDGTIASYQWTKIFGPSQFTIVSPSQAQTVISNLVQGIYQFQLTVTDNQGATGTAVMIVTVNAAPNQLPSANAGTDQTITLPVNTVTLSGSGTDPDGTIVSYLWSQIAGPTQFSIVSPTQAQTAVNNLVQGVYVFQLTVTDNAGATATDLVTITVNAAVASTSPTANAGNDITIVLPTNSVSLSGSGSSANGTISSYSWSQVSGPSQSTIAAPTQAQTSVQNLVAGIYQFELTVTDNNGLTGKDTVQVTVEYSPNRNRTTSTAKLYPNPASTTINIEIDGATEKSTGFIKIYNAAGHVVYQEVFTRDQFTVTKQIDVSSFSSGIYFVNITLDLNTQITLKFVKQ